MYLELYISFTDFFEAAVSGLDTLDIIKKARMKHCDPVQRRLSVKLQLSQEKKCFPEKTLYVIAEKPTSHPLIQLIMNSKKSDPFLINLQHLIRVFTVHLQVNQSPKHPSG